MPLRTSFKTTTVPSCCSTTEPSGRFCPFSAGVAAFLEGAGSAFKVVRTVGGLADNTPTLLATITVPNLLLGGALFIDVVGTTGDGDSTNTALYTVLASLASAGANAVSWLLEPNPRPRPRLALRRLCVTTITPGAVVGAVGRNAEHVRLWINVTVVKGAGASTLHTATAEITVINTLAGGITVS